MLSRCKGIRRLPEAMGSRINLRYLNVLKCENLESLPDGMRKITTLKSLSIEGCSDEVKNQAVALSSNNSTLDVL
jgi:hypothetical protein